MADQFYVGRGNRRFGPFSATQLRRLAAAGQFEAGDTVWREGMERPVLAVNVKNLFALPSARVDPPARVFPPLPAGHRQAETLAPPPLQGPPGESPAPAVSDEVGLVPLPDPPHLPAEEAVSTPKRIADETPRATLPEERSRRRAFAVKGAVILSQDGHTVYFRKKCVECSHEDVCRSSMVIGNGISRSHFFCIKCRKRREVQIRGSF